LGAFFAGAGLATAFTGFLWLTADLDDFPLAAALTAVFFAGATFLAGTFFAG